MSEPSRLYVIGDIHGRLDLLDRMIGLIGHDLAQHPCADTLTVTVGDYIDRGPHSRGVLERLANNPFPTPYVAIKGNHEDIFEAFLNDPATLGPQWRQVGGLETLHSFGVPVSRLMVGQGFDDAAAALQAAVSPAVGALFGRLELSYTWRDYFICHAGVRPGIPLDRQVSEDLLWIRSAFLNSRANFGKIVVHGHTPVEQPEALANRINVDTGAFATGHLTCVVLDGKGHRFLAT
jgi:serine/threonine protein phosphatase 1